MDDSKKVNYKTLLNRGIDNKEEYYIEPSENLYLKLNSISCRLRNFYKKVKKLELEFENSDIKKYYKSMRKKREDLIKRIKKIEEKRNSENEKDDESLPPLQWKDGYGNGNLCVDASVRVDSALNNFGTIEQKLRRISYCDEIKALKLAWDAKPIMIDKSINHNSWFSNFMDWRNLMSGIIESRLSLNDDAAFWRDDNPDWIHVGQKIMWKFKFSCNGFLTYKLGFHYNFNFEDDADDYSMCLIRVALKHVDSPSEGISLSEGCGGPEQGLETIKNRSKYGVMDSYVLSRGPIYVEKDKTIYVKFIFHQKISAQDGYVAYDGIFNFLNPFNYMLLGPYIYYEYTPLE